MSRDCEPCSAEINQYEDDWVCTIIEWLDKVTCIGWIRANPNSARPKEETPSGQYGTIHIDSIKHKTPRPAGNAKESENQVCARIKASVDVEIQLRVYNYAEMPCQNGQKTRTSGDVLLRILDAYYGIPRLSDALKAESISFETQGQINNYEEDIQSSIRPRSSLNITLCIERATSFADDLIAGFTLDVGCEENCN